MILGTRIVLSFRHRRNGEYLCFSALLILLVAIRIIDLPEKPLWYDELQSVTHSILPIEELLKNVRSLDPHPPFYYLQLHFWMLFGTGDYWIKLNSVVWSIVTLIMIFLLGKELFNARLALLGSLFFAVSPFAVLHAQEARMYSMLMCFAVGSFYFFYRFVARQNGLYLLCTIALALGFMYSHGAGFMILISLTAYAIWFLLENRFRQWQVFLKMCVALGTMAALYTPWLRRASSISVAHTLVPGLQDVIHTLFTLLGGLAVYPAWFKWSIVVLFTIGALACWLSNARARAIVVAFVVAPIVFCIVVSYLYRPIWLYRTLAYVVPFWSIVIAYSVSSPFRDRPFFQHKRRGLWAQYVLVFMAMSLFIYTTVWQQTRFSRIWHIRDAARFVQSVARQGDIVYVPNERVFWGVGWYLVGHGSVHPLTTDYSLTTASGVKVLAKPAFRGPLDGATYWLVYRSIDDIAPFTADPTGEPIRDFGNLRVEVH